MKAEALNRRDFLRRTGFVATGLATGGTVIFGPDYAWALSTSALDPHTAETLLVMARELFPHDRLGDAVLRRRRRCRWTSRRPATPTSAQAADRRRRRA